MSIRGDVWLGMGGVPPDDHPAAYVWERRLHWVMIGVALLSIPSFYLDELSEGGRLRALGSVIELFILGAFSLELAWMLALTSQKGRYLLRNWVDVVIVVFSLASVVGLETEWVALVRLTRLALVGLLLARAFGSTRKLLRPGSLPYVFALGFVSLLAAGAGFLWLEPTVHSFRDGLWLAFVTGSTVGYGDFVPTTTASRMFAVFMVIVGFGILSVMTASIAALLIGEDEKRLRSQMHADIRALRAEVSARISQEERVVLRELHRDVLELKQQIAGLRAEMHSGTERPDKG
ncbi:MAG: potassium channel family protein [Betaproteobacteria bacterium]